MNPLIRSPINVWGGYIVGESNQTVISGKSGSQVTAVPLEGYSFLSWSDGLTNQIRTDAEITSDTNFTASFKKVDYYSVVYQTTEGGYVDGDTVQNVIAGSDATSVKAVSFSGYYFTNWSDGSTNAIRDDLNISSDLVITAYFSKIKSYEINYSASEGGYVEGNVNQEVSQGKTGRAVTAKAFPGYYFSSWSDESTEATRKEEEVASNVNVEALFNKTDTFLFTYKSSENGFLEGNTYQSVTSGGSTTTVIAHANVGYVFTKWSDGVLTSSRNDSNIAEDTIVTAEFAKLDYYSVDYSASEGGFIEGNNSQTILGGSNASKVIAHPIDSSYEFLSWSDGVETAERTDLAVDKDLTLNAVFQKKETSSVPFVFINTKDNAAITSREEYVTSEISISNTKNEYALSSKKAGVKVRGNSTSSYPKKPYRIKFDKKQSLFGKTANKSWVLLADYLDPSSLHNYTAFNLTNYFSNTVYSPLAQHVRVYLNGTYNGLYLLTEQPDEKEGRVDIEQEITESTNISDIDFMIEFDASASGDSTEVLDETYFQATWGNSEYYFSIKYPEKEDFPSDNMFSSFLTTVVKQYVYDLGQTLISKDYSAISSAVDEDSIIDYGIVDLLMGEKDHVWKSFKLVKRHGEKLKCGPVWDYDWCLNTPWTGELNDTIGETRLSLGNIIPSYYMSTNQGKKNFAVRWNSIGNIGVINELSDLKNYTSEIYDELKMDADKWYSSDYDLIDRNIGYLRTYLVNEAAALSTYYGGMTLS